MKYTLAIYAAEMVIIVRFYEGSGGKIALYHLKT